MGQKPKSLCALWAELQGRRQQRGRRAGLSSEQRGLGSAWRTSARRLSAEPTRGEPGAAVPDPPELQRPARGWSDAGT